MPQYGGVTSADRQAHLRDCEADSRGVCSILPAGRPPGRGSGALGLHTNAT
jgi:hypothetical protein